MLLVKPTFRGIFLELFAKGVYEEFEVSDEPCQETGRQLTFYLRRSSMPHPGGIGRIWVYYYQRQSGRHIPIMRHLSTGIVELFTERKPRHEYEIATRIFETPLKFVGWFVSEMPKGNVH